MRFGKLRGRWVHPTTHRIVKFFPHNPPEKWDMVLVDGERCRVLRSIVRWEGRRWTVDGIQVEPVPADQSGKP